ncbi:MAG: Zn-dependent alcohol dehydrogenase [Acidimicrobiales bacterium]
MTRAAVLMAVDQPLEIRDDIEVDEPKAGEVRVRMLASGVCHSDLSMQNGTLLTPTPVVLGHEGAGVIETLGEGSADQFGLAVGDHVVISWVPQCGACFFCGRGQPELCETTQMSVAMACLLDGTTRFRAGGMALRQMSAAGTFAETSVIPAVSAIKVDPTLDPKVAALIGCGVLTGVGAALNTAQIAEGDTVAVVGCGGVGLNVIQGAAIAGAGEIIAVDLNPAKLELARTFGATATVDASNRDAVSGVMELTHQRGADVAFEVIGLQRTIDQTIGMTRRGGQAVLVGVPRMDAVVNVAAFFGVVLAEKTIRGCWYGGSDVRRDIPRIVDLYRQGRLKLDELISQTIRLDQVNDAFEALRQSAVARTVIEY